MLEAAAQEGFYNPLFYRDLIGDPTGMSLPLFMEELFWGCAGIGLAIVMPALALSAMAQAATPEQLLKWAPECFGEPGDLKLAALCVSEPEGGWPRGPVLLLDADGRRLRVAAVQRLPRRQRETIACRYFLELSETETAEVLGIAQGTVKSRLSRALRALRADLASEPALRPEEVS